MPTLRKLAKLDKIKRIRCNLVSLVAYAYRMAVAAGSV